MSLSVQFETLYAMFLCGLVLGLAFDVIRVFSFQFRFPGWIVSFLDIAYWVLATLFVFQMLMQANNGQIRFFVFIGLGLGVTFYFALLSRWAIWLTRLLIKWMKAIARLLVRLFQVFVVLPVKLLIRVLVVLGSFLLALAMFLLKVVVQLLYPFRVLLLWLLRPLLRRLPIERWSARIKGGWQRLRGIWGSLREGIRKALKRLF